MSEAAGRLADVVTAAADGDAHRRGACVSGLDLRWRPAHSGTDSAGA